MHRSDSLPLKDGPMAVRGRATGHRGHRQGR